MWLEKGGGGGWGDHNCKSDLAQTKFRNGLVNFKAENVHNFFNILKVKRVIRGCIYLTIDQTYSKALNFFSLWPHSVQILIKLIYKGLKLQTSNCCTENEGSVRIHFKCLVPILCIPRNETDRPRYFQNISIMFCVPISMFLWAIYCTYSQDWSAYFAPTK